MNIVNPATQAIIKKVPKHTTLEIDTHFQELKEYSSVWSQTSVQKRVEMIKVFQSLLEKKLPELADILCMEVGKPIVEARNEIKSAIDKLDFFIGQSESVLKDQKVHQTHNTKEYISYEPLGVVCNISAWNYPYLVGINTFIPALICGNCVAYKASEFSTLTGLNIAELLYESGIPQSAFKMVVGGSDVGDYLLSLNFDGYFFTGSYKTGRHIANQVAHKLIPVGLELGGKDPLYVTDEIDNIQEVSQAVLEGVFYNNGQSCCSVERVYVHEKNYEIFVECFVESVSKLVVGDPMDEQTNQGAITQSKHLNYLESQVGDALQKGAQLKCGGHIIKGIGSYFEPTVLIDVNHDMSVMREETFGPIIGIMKVANDEEAIELMNDTDYGLTSAVFSNNYKRAQAILKKVNSGTGYVNCCDRVSGYLPWSGRKNSGLGSTLSEHGLYAFCQPKALHIR